MLNLTLKPLRANILPGKANKLHSTVHKHAFWVVCIASALYMYISRYIFGHGVVRGEYRDEEVVGRAFRGEVSCFETDSKT